MRLTTKNIMVITIFVISTQLTSVAFSLISPVKRNRVNEPLLTNCREIKLVLQKIDIYHHPLGIWYVKCKSIFQNQYSDNTLVEMGFNSGYDINTIDGKLQCDEFMNFKVFINGSQVKDIRFKEVCSNYVERIGIEWTNDDNTGIGYLNTWKVMFKTEEIKEVDVTFSVIVKKPPVKFDENIEDQWYYEQMAWVKMDYFNRAENEFKLPLNMGSFWTFYPDSLIIRSYYSKQWLKIENDNEIHYDPENVKVYIFSEPVDVYSPPGIKLEDITQHDLEGMSSMQLKLLRNSFFAKYGRKFDDKLLKLYFDNQLWYQENDNYHNWYLNDFDERNIKFIRNYEKQKTEK